MKKFLIIPISIFVYIFLIEMLSQPAFQETFFGYTGAGTYGGEVVGMGTAVEIYVTRSYLFGLIRLPVYTPGLGYIGDYHDAFITFLVVLTIALLLLEFKNKKEIKAHKTKSKRR
jgi:hypothetical protein